MNYTEILGALSEFTACERIEFLPPGAGAALVSDYEPIQKYVLDLKNVVKPETAAEDLFTALCQDVTRFQPTRQVGAREGWVDFMLPEPMGQPLPLELKPLFQRDVPDALWRRDANPKHHIAQVKKYLRDNEYLILTDLRTAWFFGARDFFFEQKPFAQLPFTVFFAQCRESGSVFDTLRRVEDTAEKPELEKQFFEDLKIWFNEFDTVKWTPPEQAAESIILLINKLIFARTIEDFGLVPYRFTQDEYVRQTRRWEAKGPHRIVPKFLDEFEDFFDEYYDTEIFSARVWDRLDKTPANLQRFCDKLNFVLGINAWDQTFSRGIVHYNYRRIDEDIFGKSYEMFLATNRKDEGIYYTPAGITGPMADSLVNSLTGKIVDEICEAVGSQKCDFAAAEKLMAQLAEVRVADTACGSGGFLIKVLRCFWLQYQRVDAACAWVQKILKPDNGEMYLAEMPPNVEAALAFRRRQNFENRRVLIAQILLRHIFGVDKDPGALEVAKTNIWKEAVKLSPADYNYRLLKTDVVKILPNLELNFHAADSLVDVELGKQSAWLAEYHQAELKKLSELRARYIENPMRHEPLEEALVLRNKVRANLVEHFHAENLPCEPGGFALHFWPCWFTSDGKQSDAPGFDGIIGNPPWEMVNSTRKVFGHYRTIPISATLNSG
ncbi:MAG TPA: N-6 DNA methylase [Candidatus Saccharimonadales bacterium]|nr:N-6 DNA methylase [Candidatus Saccharimonadales bacterium]